MFDCIHKELTLCITQNISKTNVLQHRTIYVLIGVFLNFQILVSFFLYSFLILIQKPRGFALFFMIFEFVQILVYSLNVISNRVGSGSLCLLG